MMMLDYKWRGVPESGKKCLHNKRMLINKEIFTKLYIVKNKSKRKRNFIIYHFLVKRKPHERIDLLITTNVNIYQTKKSNSNENMLF